MKNTSTIINILDNENFEDGYIHIPLGIFALKKNKKIFKEYKNIKKEELIKIWLLQENKSSYYFETEKWNSFRVAVSQEGIVMRKVGTELDFLQTYYNNFFLLHFIQNTLKNGSLLISGATWTWKTTFIQSLLNFFNNYDDFKMLKVMVKKWLENFSNFTTNNKKVFDNIKTEEELMLFVDNIISNEKEKEDFFSWIAEYFKRTNLQDFLQLFDKKFCYTIERPLEYKFKKNNLMFFQNDISSWDEQQTYLKLAEISLQSNPDLLYISEIKTSKEYGNWTRVIQQGVKVVASNHADSVFQNFIRILAEVWWKEDATKLRIVSGLAGIMNIRRYETSDNSFLISYEMLDFTNNKIKNIFLKEDIEMFKNRIVSFDNSGVYFSHNESLFVEMMSRFKKWKPFLIKNWNLDTYEDFFIKIEGSTASENNILKIFYWTTIEDVLKLKDTILNYYNEQLW